MKKSYLAAVAIAALACSCVKEQEQTLVSDNMLSVMASVEPAPSKTVMDESGQVLWEQSDKITVGADDGWMAEFTLDGTTAGTTQGLFHWKAGDPFMPSDGSSSPVFMAGQPYSAYGPAGMVNLENDFPFYWETYQTYSETCRYIPIGARANASSAGKVSFQFNNLGGIFRLTVKGTATIRSIRLEVDENLSGEMVAIDMNEEGKFVAVMKSMNSSVTNNAKDFVVLDCGGNGVKLSPTGTDFHFSLPCCYAYTESGSLVQDSYYHATVTLTDIHNNTCVRTLGSKPLVIERSKITPATLSAQFNVDGSLPGQFTVGTNSDGTARKVFFSRGNLYWNGQSQSFEFEESQTSEVNGWNSDHVSHFFWSSTASAAYARDYNDSQTSVTDVFFTNATESTANPHFTANGQIGLWRTLSMDELNYLLNVREVNGGTGEGHSYVLKSFGNWLEGLVLFCDDYTGSYTDFEGIPDGCVFLRQCGCRIPGEENYETAPGGYYWTSTPSSDESDCAGLLGMDYSSGVEQRVTYRTCGSSVRLVRTAQ